MTSELVGKHALLNSADDQLDPFQYRLYGHYERVCMEAPDGVCRQGTRELATICKMSVGKVVSVRRELAELGFINLKFGTGDQACETTIAECSSHEQQPAQEVNIEADSVQDMNDTVHAVHQVNESVSYDEPVHVVNTDTSSRASSESLNLLSAKDQELKDKDNAAGATAGAREEVFIRPNAYSVWEQEMTPLSPVIADTLKDWIANYPAGWTEDAIREAKLSGGSTPRYVQSILDRWRKEGKDSPRPALVKGAGLNHALPKPVEVTPKGGVGLPWDVYQKAVSSAKAK